MEAEIIVVDNNSPDDSCAMIKLRFPKVILIENKENSGFPKGNNIGVAAAKGEYICILNPDTVVAEDTFSKILAFAERQNDLGIVGCKLIDGTGNFLPESKRGLPTPFVSFTKMSGLYRLSGLFGKYYASHLSENETGTVDILVGAFMLMKRNLYNEVGGFDERFFMYGEDIDLSYSVMKSGKSNYYFHETAVIHYKGESTIKDENYRKRFRDGMEIFYKKHFSSSSFFNFFMRIGSGIFAAGKATAVKSTAVLPQKYMLISDNEVLKSQLEQKTEVAVTMQETTHFSQSFSRNRATQIIFDNNFMRFESIISNFENHKNQNFTYRILPQSTDFLIGSDSNADRGEVTFIP